MFVPSSSGVHAPSVVGPRFVRTTEDRVRVAAVELFARRGFAATGIRDIAREAGMTSATLYHYVPSKERLLLDIMEQGQAELNAAVRSALVGATDAEHRLAVLVGVLVATHATNPMSTRVVDTEIRVLAPGSSARQAIIDLRDEHERMWQEALELGRVEGVFHVQDVSVTRLALIAMCTGMSNWFRPDGAKDVSTLVQYFVELSLGMVRANRDGAMIDEASLPPIDLAAVPRYAWEPSHT